MTAPLRLRIGVDRGVLTGSLTGSRAEGRHGNAGNDQFTFAGKFTLAGSEHGRISCRHVSEDLKR